MSFLRGVSFKKAAGYAWYMLITMVFTTLSISACLYMAVTLTIETGSFSRLIVIPVIIVAVVLMLGMFRFFKNLPVVDSRLIITMLVLALLVAGWAAILFATCLLFTVFACRYLAKHVNVPVSNWLLVILLLLTVFLLFPIMNYTVFTGLYPSMNDTRYFRANILYETNSAGFRGEKLTMHKPRKTLRLLFLGEGSTFGLGLKNEETFSHLLKNRLQSNLPGLASGFEAVEVINGGVVGNTVVEMNERLDDFLIYDIDYVFILVGTNYDRIQDAISQRRQGEMDYDFSPRFFPPLLVEFLWLGFADQVDLVFGDNILEKQKNFKLFKETYSYLQGRLLAKQVPLFIIQHPFEKAKQVEQFLFLQQEKQGVEFIKLESRESFSSLLNRKDHADKNTHRKIADQVYAHFSVYLKRKQAAFFSQENFGRRISN